VAAHKLSFVGEKGTPRDVVLRGDQNTIHTSGSSFGKALTIITLGPIFHFEASATSGPT
jgi:hypothetical protein